MIKIIAVFVLTLGLSAFADGPHKLWVSIQYRARNDRVLFIQDLETGTRCYAITNDNMNVSGYAIACVPKTTNK